MFAVFSPNDSHQIVTSAQNGPQAKSNHGRRSRLAMGLKSGVYRKKLRQTYQVNLGDQLGHFYRKYHQIHSWKALGNYFRSISAYNCSVLSCTRPTTNIFVFSRLVDLWEPLFMDLNIPSYFVEIQNHPRNTCSILKIFGYWNI